MYDKRADVDNLTTPAWHTLSEYMDHSFGLNFGWPRDDARFRTFALLVAEALETQDD